MSPIQNKRFVDELVDGNCSIDLVGWDPQKHSALDKVFSSPSKTVHLTNCNMQLNKYTSKPELLVTHSTVINQSTRQFKIKDIETVGSQQITLDQLQFLNEGDKVSIKEKVINVNESQKVGKGKSKQEIRIADSTDSAILTLWEGDIDESYQISKVNVRIWSGTRTLSFPKFGASISKIDNIGDVKTVPAFQPDSPIEGLAIIGVMDLTKFKACVSCKAKVPVSDTSDMLVTCLKCNTTQSVSTAASMMTKLILQKSDGNIMTLVAYENMLHYILSGEDITPETSSKLNPLMPQLIVSM